MAPGGRQFPHRLQRFGRLQLDEPLLKFAGVLRAPCPDGIPYGVALPSHS